MDKQDIKDQVRDQVWVKLRHHLNFLFRCHAQVRVELQALSQIQQQLRWQLSDQIQEKIREEINE